MIAINVLCIAISAWIASNYKSWSFAWWANMFASALNAAAVLSHFF